MTIAELGSLGEFLASIAVFVTLVILIIQLRSAKAEVSNQLTQEIKHRNNQAFYQLTQDPSLMEIHIRGQRDLATLSEQERATWGLWLFTWITQTEDGYVARRKRAVDLDWVDSYMLGVAAVLRSPGGNEIWPRMRHWFDEGFVEDLEAKIVEDSTTWLDMLLG